mmetsp:Transcript_8507/g.19048  ORF Transcript_8507/g.19048 Transcript_8507/m.19048 type:complete len:728 (+) Transcript_8507:256-2439(+)
MAAEEYYEQTSGLRFMSQFPRFGHSSDFSKLASSEHEEQADYVVGIAAVSFFILSLFIFWGAVIVTFKCMGKQRVGLCAGRVRVVSDEKGQFRPPTHLWTLRCTFMILGCCMMLLCAALVGPGLRSIETTSVSTRKLNRDVEDLITQGLLIMDSVKRVKRNLGTLDVELILRVEEACPNLENNTFISDKSLRSSIKGIDKEFESLEGYLENSDLEGIRQHIDYIMDGTEYIETAVTAIEKNDWIVRMFALVLGVLVFFMIFAACNSLGGRGHLPALKCMSELFILPTFVLAIVGSWFATSLLAFASISNADFCSGNSQQAGPAGTVIDIFEERGISSDNMIFAAFTYYQSGCTTEDPMRHLYKYEDDLQSGIESANKFLTKTDEIGIGDINDRCGADVSPIIEGIGLIKDNLGILLGALRSAYEFASCYKMSPMYRQAFEGTACTDSSESLTLIFLIMFAISVVGMLMIMMRSAMYPYKKVYASSSLDDEEDEWEEYQAYLRYMANFVNMWGGNEADEDVGSAKMSTYETSSELTSNARSNSPTSAHRTLGNSSTISSNTPDEEAPPTSTPHEPNASFHSAQKLDEMFEDEEQIPPKFEDEEQIPLSPPDSEFAADQPRMMYTPQAMQTAYGDSDDECTPLSPKAPNMHEGVARQFMTPNFLTPGTFRRWRRHDEVDVTNDDEMPETPLMVSPRGRCPQQEGVNYFTQIISPLRIGTMGEGGSVKTE